ncbi:protein lethal(2)k10201 [Epargyreus clarus]|uniref:protein lethal(2)k10201 n=1 Tax=Epargyreus clarus TaxID=520877 RepID=UPI003C2E4DCD
MLDTTFVETLRHYGVGRRRIDDDIFIRDKPPSRLGIYDEDDEDLCHEVIMSACTIPGCDFTAVSLLDFENHYNASHRYSCSQCKKVLPSPHLLDLHVQEAHDSFFAVMASRKPSYCCYIQECTEKFINPEERLDHCVKIHKLPKDFRFETKPKNSSKNKKKNKQNVETSMEVDATNCSQENKKFFFNNSKQKSFKKYSGKKFTSDKSKSTSVNMDKIMTDLKENLPE